VYTHDALLELFCPDLPSVSLAGGALLAAGACPSCARAAAAPPVAPALLAARWLSRAPACEFCGALLAPRCASLGAHTLSQQRFRADMSAATTLLSIGPLSQFAPLAALAGADCVVCELRGGEAPGGEAREDAAVAAAVPGGGALFDVDGEGAHCFPPADAALGEEDALDSEASREAFAGEWGGGGGAAGTAAPAARVPAVVMASPQGVDAAAEALAAQLGWREELTAEVEALRERARAAMDAAGAEAEAEAAAEAAARAASAVTAAAASSPPAGGGGGGGSGAELCSVAASITAALAAAASASAVTVAEAEGRLRAAGVDILAGAWEGSWEAAGAAEASFLRVFERSEGV
jgi:hypothetical protein